MKVAALCAGYGGLELALADVWPCAETAWVAEIDPHASILLEHRFGVPNLGDLTTITDPPPVDIVTAGFPCQPVSTAGQRKGTDDHRWIIEDVCRVASAAGASTLILENVTGLLTANVGDAMARVCAAMAATGFRRWEWTTVRASDIGACHRRERWFCVAHAPGARLEGQLGPITEGRRGGLADGGAPAHADGSRDEGQGRPRPKRRGIALRHSGATAHADGVATGRDRRTDARPQAVDAWRATQHDHRPADGPRADRFGPYQPAVDRWASILGRPAPDPLTDGRLNPRFVEWMMGLPSGWVCDVIDSRSRALHILGNGVVPQQAAAAIRELIS